MYANIIVDISQERLDRPYQYAVPADMEGTLLPGMVVQIPFGRSNRQIDGYVIELTETPAYPPNQLKTILGAKTAKETVETQLIALAAWMRENYGSTMLQALKTVLPVREKIHGKSRRLICRKVSVPECEEIIAALSQKNQKGRLRLMEALRDNAVLDYTRAAQELHITASICQAALARGWIDIKTEEALRNPVPTAMEQKPLPPLSPAQAAAAKAIFEEWEMDSPRPCLLFGVTGSGKTRVYMELIQQTLLQGKQAIVLIPEISLTHQMVGRFLEVFGSQVSIINSRLSKGERYDQFRRAKSGEVRVMIGPRSALFTPFSQLGLIIIDEEHESTYKSEASPRYHARETAIHRGETEGAHVVLGSATPSLESYSRAEAGRYRLVELSSRFGEKSLPAVKIIDLREELRAGNRSILSRSLQKAIGARLTQNEQVMLFLNRRGYAGFVSCRSCGHVMKCPHCEVSLSQHQHNRLVCHYCGYEQPLAAECPVCGSPHIGGFRAGTQQIQEIVQKHFPKARILRMDADTTRQKESYGRILEAFAQREGDILIGTQMIVKGHDFPQVTLVGVLAADLSLNAADYQSAERTFQLLTQAVGRSGRGEKKGEALIQTYQPAHYSILAAARQDYESFYRQEIAFRKLLSYPPASHLLAILAAGREEDHLATAMAYIQKFILRLRHAGELALIGPSDQQIRKINDIYRKVLYIKQKDYAILVYIKDKLEEYIEINTGFRKIQIQFDFY